MICLFTLDQIDTKIDRAKYTGPIDDFTPKRCFSVKDEIQSAYTAGFQVGQQHLQQTLSFLDWDMLKNKGRVNKIVFSRKSSFQFLQQSKVCLVGSISTGIFPGSPDHMRIPIHAGNPLCNVRQRNNKAPWTAAKIQSGLWTKIAIDVLPNKMNNPKDVLLSELKKFAF